MFHRTTHITVMSATLAGMLFALAGCGGGTSGADATDASDDGAVQNTRQIRAPAIASIDGVADGHGFRSASERPAAGFGYGANFSEVCGLFSFSLDALPLGSDIERATLHIYQDRVGTPESIVWRIVLDHLVAGDTFPVDLCTRAAMEFAFSGVLTTGDDRSVGWKAVDVTFQVRRDAASGRRRSQYRVRNQYPPILTRLTLPPPLGYFTFGDAEAQSDEGRDPYLTIQFR